VDPVTHRIVAIEESSESPVFKTKGDGNEAVDPWQFTLNSSLQAKYVFHIPYVGWALAAFTIRAVRVALLGLVGLTILGVGISLLREPKPEPSSKSSVPRGEVVRL
jgi:hypothetical protein